MSEPAHARIERIVVHRSASRWSPEPAIEMRVAWPSAQRFPADAWAQLRALVAGHRILARAAGAGVVSGETAAGVVSGETAAGVIPGEAAAGIAPEATGADFDPSAATARVAVVLQRALHELAGDPLRAPAPTPPAPGVCVFGYLDDALGQRAGRTALDLVELLAQPVHGPPRAQRAAALLDALAQWSAGGTLDPICLELVVAARRRAIPARRAHATTPIVRLGEGARQRWTWGGQSPDTTVMAATLAKRKDVAHALLRAAGLPVPEQHRVADLDGARRAAAAIGYPVVVKPAATDRGTAVTADVRDDATLESAYARAAAHGGVLVERHVPGEEYRLTVVGGRLWRATRRDPAGVTGNGRDDIATLVRAANTRRRADPQLRADPIVLDDESRRLLARQGLSDGDVPAEGRRVALRTNSNLATGGEYTHIDDLHPENALMAERAAATLGLGLAGVDFLTTDPSRPWAHTGGAICEVNSAPHVWSGVDGGERVLASFFPPPADGRIPVVLVVAPDAPTRAAWARAAHERLAALGGRVGVASADGLRIGGLRASPPASSAAGAARVLLDDRCVDAAVVALSPHDVLDEGLPFERCALALVATGDAALARADADALAAVIAAVADEVLEDPPPDALERWAPATRVARVRDPAARSARV